MGKMYALGLGVATNEIKSAKCYQLAAEHGYAKGQYRLGRLYLDGHGLQKDAAMAVRWLERSAMQGYVKAQYVLGVCYAKGYGVKKDYLQSCAWLSLAAESGDKYIIQVRDQVVVKINKKDIEEAGRLADEWRSGYQQRATKPVSL
jgi:hypothetical protein